MLRREIGQAQIRVEDIIKMLRMSMRYRINTVITHKAPKDSTVAIPHKWSQPRKQEDFTAWLIMTPPATSSARHKFTK